MTDTTVSLDPVRRHASGPTPESVRDALVTEFVLLVDAQQKRNERSKRVDVVRVPMALAGRLLSALDTTVSQSPPEQAVQSDAVLIADELDGYAQFLAPGIIDRADLDGMAFALYRARDYLRRLATPPAPVEGDDWLIRQLEAWPTRVDPERTTNIEYLMKSAAAALRASPAERLSPPDVVDGVIGLHSEHYALHSRIAAALPSRQSAPVAANEMSADHSQNRGGGNWPGEHQSGTGAQAETRVVLHKVTDRLRHPALSNRTPSVSSDGERIVDCLRASLMGTDEAADGWTFAGMQDAFFRWPVVERELRHVLAALTAYPSIEDGTDGQ